MPGKPFARRPRLRSDSYDKYMSWTELLTYTMERHDDSSPLGDFVSLAKVSLAKNAPSMEMGEQLAADKLKRMGYRWSREKPQARPSDKVQRLDCAPVSTITETSASGGGAWRGVPLFVVFGLSSSIVIGTRG